MFVPSVPVTFADKHRLVTEFDKKKAKTKILIVHCLSQRFKVLFQLYSGHGLRMV